MNQTQAQLKYRQAMPLGMKEAYTRKRIIAWYEHFDGMVYVAFSGGKDSTVLLDQVRKIYPDVPAVFCDTGLEYPEIRDFVKAVDNVVWLKPKMTFKAVIEKYGYPVVSKEQSQFLHDYRRPKVSERRRQTLLHGNKWGRGKIAEKWKFLLDADFNCSDRCCHEIKKNPSKKYEKRTGQHPFLGTMASESVLREQKYYKTGCNAFNTLRPTSTPLAFWTDKDIWDYIHKYDLPYSKIYDMGYKRTGCMFCMFGVHLEKGENRFQRMERTHPTQHNYCINKLGCGKVLDAMGVNYKAEPELFERQA